MKTINIVCDYSSVYSGNFIPSIFKLTTFLKKNNRVIISLPDRAENRFWSIYLKEQGIDLFFFDNSSAGKIIKTIKRINKHNNVDIVYTHFISTPVAKLLAGLFKKRRLIIHVHSDFSCGQTSKGIKAKIKKLLFEKIIRRDAKFIYVSDSMKQVEKLNNSYYVQNALCTDRIVSPECKTAILDAKKINILAFAWSPEVKGIDITCKAFFNVKQEYKNKAMLNIVVNENEKKKCIDFIKDKTGINVENQKNITLLEPQEDIFSLYKQSDIFISSSRSEGFSYSILEALYFGLNVCSSNIDGTKWSKEFGALLFNLDNIDELTNLIEKCIKIGRKNQFNRLEIVQKFSIQKWAENVSDILLN